MSAALSSSASTASMRRRLLRTMPAPASATRAATSISSESMGRQAKGLAPTASTSCAAAIRHDVRTARTLSCLRSSRWGTPPFRTFTWKCGGSSRGSPKPLGPFAKESSAENWTKSEPLGSSTAAAVAAPAAGKEKRSPWLWWKALAVRGAKCAGPSSLSEAGFFFAWALPRSTSDGVSQRQTPHSCETPKSLRHPASSSSYGPTLSALLGQDENGAREGLPAAKSCAPAKRGTLERKTPLLSGSPPMEAFLEPVAVSEHPEATS
mmetsp:Transcript_7381/g.16916  ORF Transcript_7381/g.16916 Transcript_7381/m.16916 type:complete len:265 (+) Transcript_7381:1213-2007(+)